jgi:transcriptional regulator with XRE-family HTH domain
MARAALEMEIRELAERAKVAPGTIVRLERGEALKERTLDAIRTAFEAAGIEFIAENGGGPGVRLRKGGPRGDPAASIPVEDLTSENDE